MSLFCAFTHTCGGTIRLARGQDFQNQKKVDKPINGFLADDGIECFFYHIDHNRRNVVCSVPT